MVQKIATEWEFRCEVCGKLHPYHNDAATCERMDGLRACTHPESFHDIHFNWGATGACGFVLVARRSCKRCHALLEAVGVPTVHAQEIFEYVKAQWPKESEVILSLVKG